jgi:hypothetical protein
LAATLRDMKLDRRRSDDGFRTSGWSTDWVVASDILSLLVSRKKLLLVVENVLLEINGKFLKLFIKQTKIYIINN